MDETTPNFLCTPYWQSFTTGINWKSVLFIVFKIMPVGKPGRRHIDPTLPYTIENDDDGDVSVQDGVEPNI